jgi:imidazolonepropionase-like amidohydrolase
MKPRLIGLTLSLCLALSISFARAQSLLIENVTIIDPTAKNPLLQTSIYIENGVIKKISGKHKVPKKVVRVDGTGKFALPGLWDMHAHLAALTPIGTAPENYVGHGVLHVRDMGGRLNELLSLRDSIRQGLRIGPTIVMAGPTLNSEKPADFHRLVSTDAEARQAVRELKEAGVDFIKIHRAVNRTTFYAIADETKKQGLTFSGHVPLVISWIEASRMGMHTIEHIQTIYENLIPDPSKVPLEFVRMSQRLEETLGDSIFSVLKEQQTYFDPTLIGYQESFASVAPEVAERRKSTFQKMKRITTKAYQAGVSIITGTDVLKKHGEMLIEELLLLESIGMPPQEVLKAATVTSARAALRPELGSIAVGSPASFLLFEQNPLADLQVLRTPYIIVVKGNVITSDEMRQLRKRD